MTHKGAHSIHFLLNGVDISGSPVEFNVNPAAALGNKSKLYPPTEPPVTHVPCELLLEAIDRYGNRLESGGSRVDARGSGPGVSACTVTDNDDGITLSPSPRPSSARPVSPCGSITSRWRHCASSSSRRPATEGGGGKGEAASGAVKRRPPDKPTEGGPEGSARAAPRLHGRHVISCPADPRAESLSSEAARCPRETAFKVGSSDHETSYDQ